MKMNEGICNCLALRSASRYITSVYDQMLSETGLRSTQFSILYKLASRGAISINELSAAMVMDRTTLARNLKPLEREMLVQVRPGEDRRERIVALTPAGTQKVQDVYPLWRKAQQKFEKSFGSSRAKDLRDTLHDVVSTDLYETSS